MKIGVVCDPTLRLTCYLLAEERFEDNNKFYILANKVDIAIGVLRSISYEIN